MTVRSCYQLITIGAWYWGHVCTTNANTVSDNNLPHTYKIAVNWHWIFSKNQSFVSWNSFSFKSFCTFGNISKNT